MSRIASVCVVLLVGMSVGCGSQGGARPDPGQAIRQFDPARGAIEGSFAKLNDVARDRPAGTRLAALSHLDSAQLAQHFAAVYALGLTATAADTARLRSLLGSGSETERLLAAASLARLGDASGIPTLIAALRSRARLSYWGPPLPEWRFARLVLLERTGRDFGLRNDATSNAAARVAVAWSRWWEQHARGFRFPANESIP